MKDMKSMFLLLLSLFVFFNVQAQLLWEISGNKLKNSSYLFGTHHLVPSAFLDSVPQVYKSFNRSETIVGEIVLSSVDAGSTLLKAAMLPPGKTLKDLLSKEDFDMLDAELTKVLKIGLNQLSQMQPQFIVTLYVVELYKSQLNINTDLFVDSYFQLVATEKAKTVVGLETMETQIDLMFNSWSLERQIELMLETFRNKDEQVAKMLDLTQKYKKGDLDGLDKLFTATADRTDFTPEEYAMMLVNRNEAWLLQLPGLMKESTCFIAVGAGHLTGDKGLIQLLKNAGYQVKPMYK
jgi:uncharacterized protein YbaP (TraB family)